MDLDQAALLGLKTLVKELTAQIEELDAKLKGKTAAPDSIHRRFISAADLDGEEPEPKERRQPYISADGRARIAAAQRARHARKAAETAAADAKDPAKAIRTGGAKRKRGRPRKAATPKVAA